MHIWMIASENGALPGGKVGGIGDVLRDLPRALASQGHRVSVFTPAYGRFHRLPGARRVASLSLAFGGRRRRAALFRVPVGDDAVDHFVLEHGHITCGKPGRIYFNDPDSGPFATDAGRFAFFTAALAAWVERSPEPPDVLHLHDWHTGLLPALRQRAAADRRLGWVRCVFTIHNLAYQGTRPLRGHRSSLEAWFPEWSPAGPEVQDPALAHCVNPMATAIRLSDRVNTVSPGYAREIMQPSDPGRGFVGGEGLEGELRQARKAGRLVGILNGCSYPAPVRRAPSWRSLLDTVAEQRKLFMRPLRPAAELARLPRRRPPTLLLSIGRVTAQKSSLFLEEVAPGVTALDAIMQLEAQDFVFIMLGSGDAGMERRLNEAARRYDRFLFLRGYTDALPDLLYAAGDLFLMPSSFEPCGISQMLAMRAGQPCVVHAVGGLRDTVRDGQTGFSFTGASPAKQARNFVATVRRALELKQEDPKQWQAICSAAAAERFTWESAATDYTEQLYGN